MHDHVTLIGLQVVHATRSVPMEMTRCKVVGPSDGEVDLLSCYGPTEEAFLVPLTSDSSGRTEIRSWFDSGAGSF